MLQSKRLHRERIAGMYLLDRLGTKRKFKFFNTFLASGQRMLIVVGYLSITKPCFRTFVIICKIQYVNFNFKWQKITTTRLAFYVPVLTHHIGVIATKINTLMVKAHF